ncbi:hypothetical protein M5D96_011253, partial [Drosophila gunungcola]
EFVPQKPDLDKQCEFEARFQSSFDSLYHIKNLLIFAQKTHKILRHICPKKRRKSHNEKQKSLTL